MEQLLGNAIQKRRKEAAALLDEVVPILTSLGIRQEDISCRVKSEESIREKIALWGTMPERQGLTPIEILEEIRDIAAITVASRDLQLARDSYEETSQSLSQNGIPQIRLIDHISDNTYTGYKGILSYFQQSDKIPFEIQFTDDENLQKRNQTHAEFRAMKYENVRPVPRSANHNNVLR